MLIISRVLSLSLQSRTNMLGTLMAIMGPSCALSEADYDSVHILSIIMSL